MIFPTRDLSLPTNFKSRDREETLIVCFDGFIKNPTEGIVRTMLSELEDWEDKYPYLEEYDDLTNQDIYDQTMFYMPVNFLSILSGYKRKEEDIRKDIANVAPRIFLDNSQITTFEYGLYQLLYESKIRKCYIWKETPFYDNEIAYMQSRYKSVFQKIELVEDVSFSSLVKETNPTTIFTNNPAFPFDYMINTMTDDEQMGKIVIILNSIETIDIIEDENGLSYKYKEEFKECTEKVRKECSFGVSPLFNFKLLYDDHVKDEKDDEEGDL